MTLTIDQSVKFLIQAIALAVLSFTTAIFLVDLFNLFWWISGYGAIIMVASIDLFFIVNMLRKALKYRKIIYVQAIAIVITSGLIASIYCAPLTTDGRFLLLRPYYEMQLAKIQAGEKITDVRTKDNLVAFYWYRSPVDNWMGLIYDPTASLSLPQSAGIFGGQMYKIHHLSDGWFICYFS